MQASSLPFSPLCLFVSSLRIDSLYAPLLLPLVDMVFIATVKMKMFSVGMGTAIVKL